MSFRSTLLLRRSTDLGDKVEIEEFEGAGVDQMGGAVLVVEANPSEMKSLSTILTVLELPVLAATDESSAQEMVSKHRPKIVLSSMELQSLEGYRLHPDLHPDSPFVYVQEADLTMAPAGIQVPSPVPEEVEAAARSAQGKAESEDSAQRAEVDSEGHPATAEAILRGFRESGLGGEAENASEPAEKIERGQQDRDDDQLELTPVQQYRAEFQEQRSQTSVRRETRGDQSERAPLAEPSEAPGPEEVPGRVAEADVQESTQFARPGQEDEYSIIERIDAEELASPSSSNAWMETPRRAGPDHGLDLYQEARNYVLDSIRNVEGGKIPDLIKGESVGERMVSSLEASSELLLEATDRTQAFAISSHSTNTAVFAIRIAETLNLSRWQRLRIALAALLHEIGVVSLPRQLIYKSEKPTLEEIKVLRQRPIYASRCLKAVEPRYDWLSEVVGQVYERENGTGHPLGLTGREICEEAKVIGISDLFDACIHQRPYRDALTGYQALFELTTDQARTFSDRIVKALIKSLSLFPYNEFVVLNSGEIGKVVEINLENLSRPVVEVLYDRTGAAVKLQEPIDLAQSPSLYISKAVPVGKLPVKQPDQRH